MGKERLKNISQGDDQMANKHMKRWVTWGMQRKATRSHTLLKSWGWGWPPWAGTCTLALRRVWHSSATAEGSSEGLQYCMALPHPTSSPRHGFQLKQKPTSTQTCTHLFKQPKCVSGSEWINKPWWTHMMKHSLTIRNKPLIITTWIQPKGRQKQTVFFKFHLYKILSNVQ